MITKILLYDLIVSFQMPVLQINYMKDVLLIYASLIFKDKEIYFKIIIK